LVGMLHRNQKWLRCMQKVRMMRDCVNEKQA
jgi:hypothetical protein